MTVYFALAFLLTLGLAAAYHMVNAIYDDYYLHALASCIVSVSAFAVFISHYGV